MPITSVAYFNFGDLKTSTVNKYQIYLCESNGKKILNILTTTQVDKLNNAIHIRSLSELKSVLLSVSTAKQRGIAQFTKKEIDYIYYLLIADIKQLNNCKHARTKMKFIYNLKGDLYINTLNTKVIVQDYHTCNLRKKKKVKRRPYVKFYEFHAGKHIVSWRLARTHGKLRGKKKCQVWENESNLRKILFGLDIQIPHDIAKTIKTRIEKDVEQNLHYDSTKTERKLFRTTSLDQSTEIELYADGID